jgi:hypothetical protein
VGEVPAVRASVDTIVASTPDRILHIRSPQKPSTLEPHPHRTSPTQTAAANQPDIQSCFSYLYTLTWDQKMAKHGRNV